MADIELVIKIPEERFRDIQRIAEVQLENNHFKTAEQIIASGTPLPKGHGKLVDIGQCDRKLFYQQCGGAESLITSKSAFDMLMSLPTIIEADKAEGSDKE